MITWSEPEPGDDPQDDQDDLCGSTQAGHWDVVHGVDGWVVYTPERLRYVHTGTEWVASRLVRGAGKVSRDEAQQFAEKLASNP